MLYFHGGHELQKGVLSLDHNDYLYILSSSARRIRSIPMDFIRPIAAKIDWGNRLIALKGARGTGKTTMILQHIRQAFGTDERALYVSLDNLWFETHPIQDVVEMHVINGGTHLFMDEVHYYRNWQTLIKNLYDEYPQLNIVYTGSSVLKLDSSRGDLSRRQIEYHLPGLSFREYLEFERLLSFPAISLEDLLLGHPDVAASLVGECSVISHFNRYLREGYYPFYKEIHSGYELRIQQVINQVLESDYPSVENISFGTVQKMKKMLMILAETAPQLPNMSKLYHELETDRNQGLKMLYALSRADILMLLSSDDSTLKNMSRPDKIYCENTNLMYALTASANIGCARETFFLNQLRAAGHTVTYPKTGDFLVDGKYLFEVGGKGKSFRQIQDLPDSFLAVDDTEVGLRSRIPLWLFGLLY